MTPAEIAQTKRLLQAAQRTCVNYMMHIRAKERRNEQPSSESITGLAETEQLITRLENDLIAAGVEVET